MSGETDDNQHDDDLPMEEVNVIPESQPQEDLSPSPPKENDGTKDAQSLKDAATEDASSSANDGTLSTALSSGDNEEKKKEATNMTMIRAARKEDPTLKKSIELLDFRPKKRY